MIAAYREEMPLSQDWLKESDDKEHRLVVAAKRLREFDLQIKMKIMIM